jgi:hypothetical protein
MTLKTLAAGQYWQATKLDIGPNLPQLLKIEVAAQMNAPPSANDAILVYIGWADAVTAGTGNPANLTGLDAAWTGYASGDGAVHQLQQIGSLPLDVSTAAQMNQAGVVIPSSQYPIVVVKNASAVAIGDGVSTAIRLTALNLTSQD